MIRLLNISKSFKVKSLSLKNTAQAVPPGLGSRKARQSRRLHAAEAQGGRGSTRRPGTPAEGRRAFGCKHSLPKGTRGSEGRVKQDGCVCGGWGIGEKLQSQAGPAGAAPGPCSEGSREPVKVSELGNDPFVAGGIKKGK